MGALPSAFSQTFPPKSMFSTHDIPDLSGKVIIVTGGNAGIGYETTKALLEHNAKVYIAARNEKNVQQANDELHQATGKRAIFLKLDLANLKAVKAAAEEFLSKESELHVLFNNGGIMVPPIELLTADGYDLTFGTNVLGHFYFTKLLLPIFLSTAKNSPDGKVRVVNTSSINHLLKGLNFATLKDCKERRKMGGTRLYNQSKYGNVIFSKELARRYGSQGIVSTSLHPGATRTKMQDTMPPLAVFFIKFILNHQSQGALTQLYAGTSPEGANLNGEYLVPWARVGKAEKGTQDPGLGRKLWAWLDEQTQEFEARLSVEARVVPAL